MDEYRIAVNEEKDCCDEYEMIVGPNDFECVLTEPEDRTWYRDLSCVINELNRLLREVESLKESEAELKQKIVNEIYKHTPNRGWTGYKRWEKNILKMCGEEIE